MHPASSADRPSQQAMAGRHAVKTKQKNHTTPKDNLGYAQQSAGRIGRLYRYIHRQKEMYFYSTVSDTNAKEGLVCVWYTTTAKNVQTFISAPPTLKPPTGEEEGRLTRRRTSVQPTPLRHARHMQQKYRLVSTPPPVPSGSTLSRATNDMGNFKTIYRPAALAHGVRSDTQKTWASTAQAIRHTQQLWPRERVKKKARWPRSHCTWRW